MNNDLENLDPNFDPNADYKDTGYSNPNNADAVPSLNDYFARAGFNGNNPPKPYNLNDELTAWNDRLRLSHGLGLSAQRLTNSLMGFNHRMVNDPVATNREYGTVTFITRPDCNLSEDNIGNSRILSNMAEQGPSSLDYSILGALDPDFELGFTDGAYDNKTKRKKNRLGTPFRPEIPFDNLQAFIPILSKNLISLSGAPDQNTDAWLAPEGQHRETYGMVDSTYKINNGFTASATFNNPIGDPIMRLASVMLDYSSGVKEGRLKPKIRNSIQRRIDYQHRAYFFKFDALGNIVRWANLGAFWFTNDNAGEMINIDNSKPMTDNTTVTLQMQCIGARYWDAAYLEAFNFTVGLFNPDMIPEPEAMRAGYFRPMGHNSMVRLQPQELPMFNYYGYPRVNIFHRKLEWWVYIWDYNYVRRKAGIIS